MKKATILGAAVVATLCATAAVALQDGEPTEAGFMSPEAMAAMAPGPHHKFFAPLSGSWDMTIKMKMAPEAPWEVSQAECEREVIFDGRYLTEVVKSAWMGMPFEGHGLYGHDNVRGEYVYTWYDNMSTSMMVGSGTISDDKQTISFECTSSDPMSGNKEAWFKTTVTVKGPDENVFTMWAKDEAGDAYQHMEITSTRK